MTARTVASRRSGDVAHRREDGNNAGLTLLEMLIVLAVIAIATGATLLSLGPRRGDPVEVEARRLAATIGAAADRSIATGAETAIVVDPRGYAITGAARHELPSGIALRGAAGPVLPLTLAGGHPFDLIVTQGTTAWRVSFDGVRAGATVAESRA